MIELHLIGYTEDGDHLVLDLDADGEGRYLVAIDPDLLATLETVREERLATGKPVDERAPPVPVPPAPPEPVRPEPAPPEPSPPAPTRPEPALRSAVRPVAGDNGSAASAATPVPDEAPDLPVAAPRPVAGSDDGSSPTSPASRLTPAQIQARLRAGRSVRAVAREAEVDRDWVERWNEPIRAERERVLADARARRVDVPRARPLGTAVDRSLTERGVEPASAAWRVVRRDDGRWRVSVRFEERGRARTATWVLDPDAERLRAQSRLAAELSAPGHGRSGRARRPR